jgi:PAS domain S-box-containing protein
LDQRCTYWNKAAERLYGWENANVYGQNVEPLIFRDRAYFERAKSITLQKGEWHDKACIAHHGEQVLTVESRWTLVCDDAGKPRSLLIINTDVSEQKKIEAQFLRTQRLDSIGTLAGGIAHDLNNVLSPIMMSVEVLKGKLEDDQSRRMLTILESSARRGAEMVKQVLTFARGVEGERVLLQPRHLLRDVVKMVGETFPKTVQCRSKIAETLWPIMGDATQLHQVLVNLTVNARDAMPDGGALTISAENYVLETDIEHNGALILPGFYVLIRVTDTGTGIPSEVLEKVFDPFFTTKEPGKGTGLGLSTVLGIVKSHGGFVQIQTEVNKGTTFLIYLPAQEGMQTQTADNEPRDLPSGNGELLLAVDDEAAVLTMTKETLEAFGYRVITARDGAEAIATYTAHRNEIKGVLTDMLMPHMDGPSTIRVLKRIDPLVRIIAASGLMDNEKVKDATGLENIAFLMKPFTADKLLTAVHKVLSEAA